MADNGAPTLADLIPALRQEVENGREAINQLETELGIKRRELKRWERALVSIDPESLPSDERPPSYERKRVRGTRRRERRMSEERFATFRDDVLEYAKSHDEFRQVEIRAVAQAGTSALTEGFERLRQEGIIRLARRQGNSKWFRLTPAAQKANA